MTTLRTGEAPNAAIVKPTVTLPLYAETTPAVWSAQTPMRPRSTHALYRFARRAQPAPTRRFAAPTVIRLTRPVTPTALRVSRFANLPKQTRMQPQWETPHKWE